MTFKTKGVCAQSINFEIEDAKIKTVEFVGGCSGNTQGVSRLVEGMTVEDAIQRLEGICCGNRSTSCPDQLAMALRQATK
jgi:uncharacterized protein (TIGR03905 family)